jgi:GTP cyclohydrolase I
MTELCSGYTVDIGALLATTFHVAYDEMVVVRGVEFMSLCEHHLLPFTGHVTVGYVPTDRVVGLSKIPRVIEAFSHRLQIQERMTHQIASALQEHLDPLGVGVVVTASHSCMAMRGVRKHGEMVTSAMLGLFRDNPEARAELLALHRQP